MFLKIRFHNRKRKGQSGATSVQPSKMWRYCKDKLKQFTYLAVQVLKKIQRTGRRIGKWSIYFCTVERRGAEHTWELSEARKWQVSWRTWTGSSAAALTSSFLSAPTTTTTNSKFRNVLSCLITSYSTAYPQQSLQPTMTNSHSWNLLQCLLWYSGQVQLLQQHCEWENCLQSLSIGYYRYCKIITTISLNREKFGL